MGGGGGARGKRLIIEERETQGHVNRRGRRGARGAHGEEYGRAGDALTNPRIGKGRTLSRLRTSSWFEG